ncbi:E3 ubiquitin-protein ligase RZFP34 [Hondaea fermentalgiana]|uniref:E3 ubiquitin-protein ligase RZFP34 n=1 Tax=Hondaea fermentalgiana TaxID=2315210 RepID=A0A2R5G4R7_9STRA|nr:E3 ubiquitin-protein ligase RZFP34 [Hondaea fermentalgiana]|eukprot:GBG26016.1 E3 ubiquitin-protein ligase RZFP34 [Hondaea fermentalgiana]
MGNNSDSAAGGAPLHQGQESPTVANLNERIRAIALDLSLGVEERTKKIQELYSLAAAVPPTATATSVTAANATALAGTSATDEEGGNGNASSKSADDANVAVTMGTPLGLEACRHYKRQCSILSNCCGKIYPCRLLCLPPGVFSNHTCVDSSNKCVACFERMQDSTRQIALLRCGHAMHKQCQDQALLAGAHTCPICRVSYLDQGSQAVILQQIEETIAAQPMPDEYKNWVAHIHCDDCQKSAAVPFHFLAHICPSCKSFNTVVLSRKRGPPRDENPEDAQEILQEGQELPSPAPGWSSAQAASAANVLASDVGMEDSFVDDVEENDSNDDDDDDEEEE